MTEPGAPGAASDAGSERADRNRRLARRLGLGAVVAFGFGFAMAPLYDVFCRLTGVNGKTVVATEGEAVAATRRIDRTRAVVVDFMGHAMPGNPWEFRPMQVRLTVHPGEVTVAKYVVKNPTDRVLHGRAVPSVTPGEAGLHFKKIECFCFQEVELKPGEVRELPVRFVVDADLPTRIHELTLSYAFYDAEQGK